MANQKILTMQDLSCVGQCSLTVALPILSAYGLETCVLPTAVLSNHTAFRGWSYLDLTAEIANIFRSWEENGFRFLAFLLGYLGKPELMRVAEECFDRFSEEDAVVILDPVLGDNGKLYAGFDARYVDEMRKLLKRADIILPNVTEACFLTGVEYREDYDFAFVERLGKELSKLTDAQIVITGAVFGQEIGEVISGSEKGEILLHERLPQNKHGTGDIFASVFTAHYLSKKGIRNSCNLAAEFVADCIRNSDEDHFYGVNFERILKRNK